MTVFFKIGRRTAHSGKLDLSRVPKHIGIIMDGNGRWAKRRGLPRRAGHKAGADNLERICDYCNSIGVKALTVYAFSTENWNRPKDEVDALMELLYNYLLTVEAVILLLFLRKLKTRLFMRKKSLQAVMDLYLILL